VDVLIAELECLPRGVRIVATTRNDPVILRRVAGLRALELDAQSPDNVTDIERCIESQRFPVKTVDNPLAG
jgi:hypothetical protein